MKQNYQLVLEKTLKALQAEDKRPSLLLHSCCGPCSSYVMEYLAQYFDIIIPTFPLRRNFSFAQRNSNG